MSSRRSIGGEHSPTRQQASSPHGGSGSSQRAASPTSPAGGGASSSSGTPADQVVVTLHQIGNLPKAMQQLDPNRTQLEVVVSATAKYYLIPTAGGPPVPQASVARLELNPLVVPFSPSSIMFRRERFVIDFDGTRPTTANGGTTTVLSPSSPQRAAAATAANIDALASSASGADSNRYVWQFPSPPTTTTTLEIFVGLKERRVGSSTAHWVASAPMAGVSQSAANASTAEQQGAKFLVPCEAVFQQKVVTKIVGLSVGQVALSFTVAPTDAVQGKARMRRAVQRASAHNFDLESAWAQYGGEIGAHCALQRSIQPNCYKQKLERLFQLYTQDAAAHAGRVQEMLKEYAGKEEFMMRAAALELGPELSSVGPKHRLAAFMKKFKLVDSDVAAAFPPGQYNATILEQDTEKVFDVLSTKFGNEPRPTSYLFPPVAYDPDRRAFLLENLTFPINKPNGRNWRDIALAARQKRVPFTSSPHERDMHKTSRSGRQLSEIEILQEKHEPEFKQIIPSIAESLGNVVQQHAQLARVIAKDDRFAIYETNNVPGIQLDDYVHRIAEYTYISPASMLAAAIFLDRLCEKYPSLLLTERNIFKLFFVAVRVSSKVVDLRSLNNKNFASVGGVSNKHLNDLEETFLKHLRFDLFLSPTEFLEYGRRMHPPNLHSQVPRHLLSNQNSDTSSGAPHINGGRM
ncbi:cyclin 10, putative [Bodo saltans]|uniref:Cyclin 10, putative n=1 Tax=Bodo saltans TaxID=75058 RepID=A0A0S4IWW1_BODSA|nr:cyclin 10, putative [Bodo saltans]|eukprot:CUG32027.1 cyclin 10, putative [Bodo saltans]